MTSKLRFLIVGGHGKVAQHLTRHALKNGHTVYSLIRNPDHASDLPKPPASQDELLQPVVFSLEAESVSSVADLLKKHKPNVVVFAAGAGGKGGQERTRAVDYEGAVKVFDALEQSKIAEQTDFRRFLLVSAVDSRDPETSKPDWYGEEDYARSQKTREAIGYYMQMKYEADKNLSQRKAFPWFVLRPGGLSDEPSKNGVMLGERKTITVPVRAPSSQVQNVDTESNSLTRRSPEKMLARSSLQSPNNLVEARSMASCSISPMAATRTSTAPSKQPPSAVALIGSIDLFQAERSSYFSFSPATEIKYLMTH